MYGSDTESYHYSDSDTEDDVGCPQPRAVESGAMAPPRDLWSEMLSAEAQQQRGQASSPRGAQPRGGDDDDADSPVSSQSGGGARGWQTVAEGLAEPQLELPLVSRPLSESVSTAPHGCPAGLPEGLRLASWPQRAPLWPLGRRKALDCAPPDGSLKRRSAHCTATYPN